MQSPRKETKKQRVGTVVSDRMEKTITVRVDRTSKHREYTRSIKLFSTYKAHDEKNEAKAGDVVRIIETRPLSKDKRWRLVKIIERPEK
ncbi:MAG: 30S ribosomal protein S17 [Candidatus Omnitrophota bacterium]